MKLLGWLLGLDNLTSIDQFDLSLGATWAAQARFWIFLCAILLLAGSLVFYVKLQSRGSLRARASLGICRGLLLTLLLLTLLDPTLRITILSHSPPTVYLLFDGTSSMEIQDRLSRDEQSRISAAIGMPSSETPSQRSRSDYLKGLLLQSKGNLLRRLQQDDACRIEAFLFAGQHAGVLRKLEDSESLDPERLTEQLTTDGQVTALGSVLGDLRQQFGASQLAAIVIFSDFAQNSGPAAVGSEGSPAERLGVPLYTVGLGAVAAKDLAVDLQPPPKMKRAERSNLRVRVTHSAMDGQQVTVHVKARAVSDNSDAAAEMEVGQETIRLDQSVEYVNMPFIPREAGRIVLTAWVEPAEDESVAENNSSSRQVNVIDDYLRLLYVAFEPTWEWRFVKEVFHRDKLVGMRGFRTYLQSSDPLVRQTSSLFLNTHLLPRGEFFATDVMFLDDLPGDMLTPRFCDMVKEYVSRFGGGLVVLAGPRFGPDPLANTGLADLLPVVVEPNVVRKEQQPFRLQLTPDTGQSEFMQLGSGSKSENVKAWDNLGELPWYQPVSRIHSLATVLAEHPTDTCADGHKQPLIAIRRYGRGQVVYFGVNEMWRLRRRYGEKYYRQFWSQLINYLGLSHALGSQKRFVARTDRPQYQADEQVTLTVDAYNQQYAPLTAEMLGDKSISAELVRADQGGAIAAGQDILLGQRQPGEFEARFPVYEPGDYRLRVSDPVTGDVSEIRFDVASRSAEFRSGVRDADLQESLARETGGRAYDLENVWQLPNDLQLKPVEERFVRNQALWSTPLWFLLIVGLMLGEWLTRKLIRLT